VIKAKDGGRTGFGIERGWSLRPRGGDLYHGKEEGPSPGGRTKGPPIWYRREGGKSAFDFDRGGNLPMDEHSCNEGGKKNQKNKGVLKSREMGKKVLAPSWGEKGGLVKVPSPPRRRKAKYVGKRKARLELFHRKRVNI